MESNNLITFVSLALTLVVCDFHTQLLHAQDIQTDTSIHYDEPITIINQVFPKYPPSALKDSIEGQVLIKSLVNEEGNVDSVWVSKSVRHDLDSAACEAASKRTFTPATVSGKLVKTMIIQCFRFKCRGLPGKKDIKG